jgi:hypothetical protein
MSMQALQGIVGVCRSGCLLKSKAWHSGVPRHHLPRAQGVDGGTTLAVLHQPSLLRVQAHPCPPPPPPPPMCPSPPLPQMQRALPQLAPLMWDTSPRVREAMTDLLLCIS